MYASTVVQITVSAIVCFGEISLSANVSICYLAHPTAPATRGMPLVYA